MKILYIDFGNDVNQTKKEVGILSQHLSSQKVSNAFFQESSVVFVNLQDAIKEFKESGDIQVIYNAFPKSFNINEFEQIILGAHGIKKDVKNRYSKPAIDTPIEQLFTADQFAKLCQNIFNHFDLKTQKDILLLVCYGARTSNYEADHINEPISHPLDSFAYRVFSNLGQHYNIEMTAATGAIRIGDNGMVEVETEEAITFSERQRESLKLYQNAKQIFEAKRSEFLGVHTQKEWNQYEDSNLVSDDRVLDEVCRNFSEAGEHYLSFVGSEPMPETEYGQVAFKYDQKSDNLTVNLQHKGKSTKLYEGPLQSEDQIVITQSSSKKSGPCQII